MEKVGSVSVSFTQSISAEADVQVWVEYVSAPDDKKFGNSLASGIGSQVRHHLSKYLGTPLSSSNFIRGASGRPRLACDPAILDFNVSHSGRWIVLAASHNTRVGIDIELCGRLLSTRLMTWLACREGGAFEALIAWTLNEAFVKAIGCGLRERNIGGIARKMHLLNSSVCGTFRYGLIQRQRWTLLTVLREPLLLGLALRHDAFDKPLNISINWCGSDV